MSMLLSLLSLPTTLNLTPHTPLHLNPLQQHLTCQHRFQALPVTLQLRAEKQGLQALVSLQLGGWQWSLTGRGQEVGGWQLKLKKEEAPVGCLEMPLLERLKEDEGGEEEGRLAVNGERALSEEEIFKQSRLKQKHDLVVTEKMLSLNLEQHNALLHFCSIKEGKIFYVQEVNNLFSDEEQFEMLFFGTDKKEIMRRWSTDEGSECNSEKLLEKIFHKNVADQAAGQSPIKHRKNKDRTLADWAVEALTEPFKRSFDATEVDHHDQAALISSLLLFNFPQLRSFLMHGRGDQFVSMRSFFNGFLLKSVLTDFSKSLLLQERNREDKMLIFKKFMESLFDQKAFKQRADDFIQTAALEDQTLEDAFRKFRIKAVNLMASLSSFYFSECKKSMKKDFARRKEWMSQNTTHQKDLLIDFSTSLPTLKINYPTYAEIKLSPERKFQPEMRAKLRFAKQNEICGILAKDDAGYLKDLGNLLRHLENLNNSFRKSLYEISETKFELKRQLSSVNDLSYSAQKGISQESDYKISIEYLEKLMGWDRRLQHTLKTQSLFLQETIKQLRQIDTEAPEFQDEINDHIQKSSQNYLKCLEQTLRPQDFEVRFQRFRDDQKRSWIFANEWAKPESVEALSRHQDDLEAWMKPLSVVKTIISSIEALAAVGRPMDHKIQATSKAAGASLT